ncbi:MAG: radical SAM protein [Magnetococcales bacterium]|nr:radical SAM protein [Magnetococcales bacterium]
MSILYAASVAIEAGLDVLFLDALGERLTLEQTRDRCQGYDVVVVLTSTMTFAEDMHVLKSIKSVYPDLRVVLFGSHPTFLPEHCLAHELVTAVVMREPEYALRDLLLAWDQKKPWEDVPGIAYRMAGKVHINPAYPYIKNLDDMPIPHRHLLPKGEQYYNPLIRKYPYVTMLTSRGCPAKCTFCTAPYSLGMSLRVRSAASVLKEMSLVAEQGCKTVYFRDETFCAYKKRNVEICKGLISRGIRLQWIANAISGELDEDYLQLMKKAGLCQLKFGVETGNAEILARANKKIDLNTVRKELAMCRKIGIRTHAHMMLGMPGETRQTIENTFRFIHEAAPTTVTYSVCSPYPGTPLFEEISKLVPSAVIVPSDDLHIKQLHTVSYYNEHFTELTNQEIEAAVQEGYRRFYTRPAYLLRSLLDIRSFREAISLFRSGWNVMFFSLSGDK